MQKQPEGEKSKAEELRTFEIPKYIVLENEIFARALNKLQSMKDEI